MTDYLSKELKFFIKLMSCQPYLVTEEVTRCIPHQNMLLSHMDILHVALLVLSKVLLNTDTKYEYSMMFLCRELQRLKN